MYTYTGTILLAMSSVASVLVPNERAKAKQASILTPSLPLSHSLHIAKFTADRLMWWGVVLGCFLGRIQLSSLPLLSVFSPLKEVQEQARGPAIIGAVLQIINGVVFIGKIYILYIIYIFMLIFVYKPV